MSSILLLSLFTVIIFVLLVAIRKLFGSDGLFVVGIGSIIAANIYNVGAFPLIIGDLIFGLDSIIYTVFALCALLMYIDYGVKTFKVFLFSALGSTLLTAFFAFWGNFSQVGISSTLVWTVLSYISSVIATFVAIIVAVWLLSLMRRKNYNIYLALAAALVAILVINTVIYFGLTFLIQGSFGNNFIMVMAGSAIAKIIAVALAILAFFIGNKLRSRHK